MTTGDNQEAFHQVTSVTSATESAIGQKIVQKEAEIGTEADHEIGAGHGKEGT